MPLSFRHRLPIDISLAVLVTGLCIAGSVLWHDFRALHAEAAENGERLGRTLARALANDLKLDERWHAYKTLRAMYHGAEPSWLLPEYVLVLGPDGRTLVASDPVRFPMAIEPAEVPVELAAYLARPSEADRDAVDTITRPAWTFRVTALDGGASRLGHLVLAFSQRDLWVRFSDTATQVVLATGTLLLLLLPFGWWVGWRIARPFAELERCVARLGDDARLPTACVPETGRFGEIDSLRMRIEQVAGEIREKKTLEGQIVRSERQAALGRLAAGIAHEINNPLGGMLTAIAMYKRTGTTRRWSGTPCRCWSAAWCRSATSSRPCWSR